MKCKTKVAVFTGLLLVSAITNSQLHRRSPLMERDQVGCGGLVAHTTDPKERERVQRTVSVSLTFEIHVLGRQQLTLFALEFSAIVLESSLENYVQSSRAGIRGNDCSEIRAPITQPR